MKINEICIGDKVKITGRRRIYTVTKITGNGYAVLTNRGCLDVGIERIKPIALTPYILTENGFECDNGEVWQTCWKAVGENGDDDLEVVFKDDGSIQTKFDVAGMYLSTDRIKYVHQLQHLLRICELDDNLKW